MAFQVGSLINATVSAIAAITGAVTLGGVELTGIQAPEKIVFGGIQQTKEHKLIGGARVIDVLGPDEADIKFSGIFLGPLAINSAQQLDALRQSGVQTTLSWSGFSRQVIVKSFSGSAERGGYLYSYQVSCVVIPTITLSTDNSLLGSLVNDVGSALGIPNLMSDVAPVVQDAQTAMTVAQAALPVVGVLTGGSPAFVALNQVMLGAQNTITQSEAVAETVVAPMMNGPNVLGTTVPGTAVVNMQSAVSGTQSMAALSSMGAYTGRAVANLGNVGY